MKKNNLRELNFKEMLGAVKAIFLDVDGVLSDSQVIIAENGQLIRTTNVKDGYILKYAITKGFIICIISGGLNSSVKLRYEALGVHDVVIGSRRKIDDFNNLLKKHKLKAENVLYMGDDIPDFEVMQIAGLACCPKDAADEIKEISDYVSAKEGGKACVRDIVEQVLRAQGKWMDEDAFNM